MKLRQCIECSHLADPHHVYNCNSCRHAYYAHPEKTWWQTWHWGDEKHGEVYKDRHHYFSELKFLKELYKYLTGGRKQRNKDIKHMTGLRRSDG